MGEWTLEELAQRVAGALAADGVRAPNSRVTAVPDGRIIRWYATIGLVDRPQVGRGRTARYGPRHLLQLVAIKRRQAQGCSLAQIQAELTGATDAMLRRVAAVPAQLLEGVAAGGPATDVPATDVPATDAPATSEEPCRPAGAFWAARPAASSAPAPAVAGAADPVSAVLCGVQLGGAAVLLLPRVPHEQDVPAIRSAAGPLLDLLAERGLLGRAAGADRAT